MLASECVKLIQETIEEFGDLRITVWENFYHDIYQVYMEDDHGESVININIS